MKQCSICGHLFEPEDPQSLRCPRCGVDPEEISSSETTSQPPSAAQTQPLQTQTSGSDPQQTAVPVPDASNPEKVSEPEPAENAAASPSGDVPTDQLEPDCSPEEQPFQENRPESSQVPAKDSDAPLSPPTRRKHRWITVIGFILLLSAVAIGSYLLGIHQAQWFGDTESTSSALQVQPNAGEYYDPQGVSPEEFARLELGMTYAQISGIIGGDAYQTTEPDVSGSYSAAWQGQEDPQAVLTVRFVNGQAADLQQSGLEQTQTSDLSQAE